MKIGIVGSRSFKNLELLKKENGYYRNLYEVQFLQEEVV